MPATAKKPATETKSQFGRKKGFTKKRKAQGSHKSIKKGSLYYPPDKKAQARIIKIDTPANARTSASRLRIDFNKAKSVYKAKPTKTNRTQMRKIMRATDLGEKRAIGQLERRNLSNLERIEMRQVRDIYGEVVGNMEMGPVLKPKKKK